MTTEGGKMHSELQEAPAPEAPAHLDSKPGGKGFQERWPLKLVTGRSVFKSYKEITLNTQVICKTKCRQIRGKTRWV